MVPGVVVGAGLLLGSLAVVVWAFSAAESGSTRSEEVLPAHYESLLHADPSNYPGYCTHCGTSNDPDRSICRECSAELDGRDRRETDRAVEH